MKNMLKASLEETATIRTKEDALDYIAKKGNHHKYERVRRMRWATMILEDKFLLHVCTGQQGHLNKAYFVGYIVNRFLTASLRRANEDDRDYYGKKRLEMAG